MSVLSIVRAELFRMTRTRAGRVGLLAPALLAALQLLGNELLERFRGGHAAGEAGSAFGALGDGVGGLGSMALAMIALLVGAFALVRERDLGTFPQLLIVRSRSAIVLGKAIAIACYVLFAFTLQFAASAGVAALFHDFGPIVEDGYEMASAGEQWLEALRAISAGLPAVVACACFGLLVSALAPSVGAAAVGAVVPFTLLALFQSTLGPAREHLFVTYAPFFSEHAPLARFVKVARAFSDTHWEPGELWHAALVPGVEGAAFLLLAWIVTKRRAA